MRGSRNSLKYAICVACYVIVCAVSMSSASYIDDTTITAKQAEQLQKFKEQVSPKLYKDWMKDDLFLVRFLRAQKFDVHRAKEMLTKHLRWRQEFNLDSAQHEDWSEFRKEFSYSVDGRDRDGRVILRYDFGEWDLRKASLSGKMPKLTRYFFKMWDETRMKTDETASEKNVTRCRMIINMDRVNAIQQINVRGIPFILTVAAAYEPNFPLLAEEISIINTPMIFESIMPLIRPMLSEETNNALKMYGKDPNQWGPILLSKVDPSQLPLEFGGSLLSE